MASALDAPSILEQGADSGPDNPTHVPKLADPGAAAWLFEPGLAFAREQYGQRKLPLWNPYQAYGAPFAANMQSQPFYPLTMALLLRLTPRTYNFYLLARLFAAGICAYLYLRLFLSFPAAITGAIGCMFSGYYILFISMPHLSVEVLAPAMLLVTEYLLRKQSYGSIVSLALAVALVVLGGMPESAFLLLGFATVYAIFRICSQAERRTAWKRLFTLFGLASTAGVALSAFLLFPFYEYLTHSVTYHESAYKIGLQHDRFDLSLFTYVIPLLFGPIHTSTFVNQQFRNYFGILSIFPIAIAIGCVLRRRKYADVALNRLTYFFCFSAVVILLKRFGIPPIHWLGALPLFSSIRFVKYDEPLLTCCVWALASIGIERIWRREAGLLVHCVSAGLVVLTFVAAIRIPVSAPRSRVSTFGIDIAAIVIAALVVCLLFGVGWRSRRAWLAPVITALVAFELSFNYIAPIYRIYGHLPSARINPFAGGPVVRFLEQADKDRSRVFGRNWVLTPNWASVFTLPDIRDLDAMYYERYFPFVRNFLPVSDRRPEELFSCFLGDGAYDFDLPLQKRLLQLSSVKYLATSTPFVVSNPRIDEILQQNQGRLLPGKQKLIGRTSFVLNGAGKAALGEHPPYVRLPYTLRVPDQNGVFHFSYALNPAVFFKAGDGVGFTIEMRDTAGHIEKLFSRYIDPKHNPDERRWMNGEIDLSRYRGHETTLLFSTDPGPRGDSSFDWAAWSDFHFESDPPQAPPPFKLVYDAEAKVYEYNNVLPRAAIYYNAALEPNDADVLHRLADPSLDVFRTVVLDASKLSKREIETVEKTNKFPVQPMEAGRIELYRSNRVEIEASLTHGGILVLNDTGYPGWRVAVDERPAHWFAANYLFRGVFLGPGTHVVRFEYSPASFYWGLSISSLTLGLLAVFRIVPFGLR